MPRVHRFTLAEIQSATQNFSSKLLIDDYEESLGKVYNCSMSIGGSAVTTQEVVIKRFDSPSEIEALLYKSYEVNFGLPIGYCIEGKERVLVYEFIPNINGNLKDQLQKPDHGLSWLDRLQIFKDIGENSRWCEYFEAQVLSGPIYNNNNQTSEYVYSYGALLMEGLSGKQRVDLNQDGRSLSDWIQNQVKKGKMEQLVDSRLKGQISRKCLREYVDIALQCLHNDPKRRPTMAQVVVRLESILRTQESEKSAPSVFHPLAYNFPTTGACYVSPCA